MYADDTSLLCKAKNDFELQVKLESCLNKVADCFKANELTLNVDKTKFMIFGTKQKLDKFHDVKLNWDNINIERVDEFKYLGVKCDNNLSWSSHIDYMCKNVSKRIGIIRRVKHYLPFQTVVLLSNALVLPHFDYGSTVWTIFSLESHNKLQVLHNSLARTILSADYRTPTNEMMDTLNWIKLDRRWNNQLLLLVFKCLKNLCPSYLCSQFDFVHNGHTHITRNHCSNTLLIPKFRSNSGMRTFHVRAAYAWNSLSPDTRTEYDNMSVSLFKSKVYDLPV